MIRVKIPCEKFLETQKLAQKQYEYFKYSSSAYGHCNVNTIHTGLLGEYAVSQILGVEFSPVVNQPRGWDIEYNGLRIDVKTWENRKWKKYGGYISDTQLRNHDTTDVYVFCIYNPEPWEWDIWVMSFVEREEVLTWETAWVGDQLEWIPPAEMKEEWMWYSCKHVWCSSKKLRKNLNLEKGYTYR